MFNATLLSWIKAEVDHALKVVRENIARFAATPAEVGVLSGCPPHLHQVSGALRIIGLAGASRFCETIEGSFKCLDTARPDKNAVGVMDRAVLALNEFVDDLGRGRANVPLRLFPVYRELNTLQGKTDVSEKDLFFPELTAQAPAHPVPKIVPKEELGPFLQAQRARFQRGLLSLLRNQPGGVHEMRQALEALHQVAAQLPEPRALWWIALGLIDGLSNEADAEWTGSTRALCNKIDFQIRNLESGSLKGTEPLLADMLYAIAKCKPVTARVKEIKQLYQLDSLFPEPELPGLMEFNMDWLLPELINVRSRLEALKNVWLRYTSGEPKSAARVRELVASFKDKAAELGNQHLVKLLDLIAYVSMRLPDPYPPRKQFMVIEMASAFLLVETVIDNFTDPPADFEQQIVIMGGWLLDAASGKSSGEPPAGLRADLTQQIGVLQLRAQVAKEILTNLQHVEQVLDAFSRDPAKRDALPGLKPYLHQIHGALRVLSFERAAELLAVCDRMIDECAKDGHIGTGPDMDQIADGLSTLGFYLDACLHGREPTGQAITVFFTGLSKRAAQAAGTAGHEAAAPAATIDDAVITIINAAALASEQISPAAERALERPPAAVATSAIEAPPLPEPAQAPAGATPTPAVNEELLAIYLEEADEVLANIERLVPICRDQPRDGDALTSIRRGFHTLKGSGRMVGLTDLGEIAWEIEQVMNRWLEQRERATPGLLELLTLASSSFAAWVAQLRAGKPLTIDARRIVDLARRLKAGEESEALQPVPAPAAPSAFAPDRTGPPPQPEEVTIGSVRLARSLFDIYVREAAQHMAALDTTFDAWRNTPGADASHHFLRAAHTLASSSRTTGFTEIAELAGAIEMWIPFARQVTQPREANLIQAAIAKLHRMVDAVTRREPPGTAEDATRSVHDLTARLQAAPPPLLETRGPASDPATVPATVPPYPAPTVKPVPAAPAPKELRRMQDDLDEGLLPIFLEEAQELLPAIGSDMRDWKENPGDEKVSQSLQRALHTLKGSARMAGAIRLGELTHLMESRIEAAIEANDFSAALFEDLESKMDRLSLELERMKEVPHLGAAAMAAPAAAQPADEARHEAAARAEPPLPSPATILRVNAGALDHLINESGEISIARSRIEAELRLVKQSLADLGDSVSRLRSQLREVEMQADSQTQSRLSVMGERNREFDPLEFDRYTRLQELTRLMAESLHDVSSVQLGLVKNLGETDAALLHQARISRNVQQELMRMRTVPFSNLNERLYRIVRQSARELDKKAELEIQDSQVELDRSVLEKIAAPLEHMLRNAVAHGLESPAGRSAAAKPEIGRITITLRPESNEIALILADDGAGMDLERLRQKAIEKGMLGHGEVMADAELAQLIFASGLSTAESVTELSGRGVGMDVVRSEISSIGGRVDIATARGKGTTFTIYLPLTLAVTQTVLVRCAGSIFAISSAMVEQVMRLKADAMAGLYEKGEVAFQDRSYPLRYLQHLLGLGGAATIQSYNTVLLLRSGMQRIAVHVDELTGSQEIVVKNIGPQLSRLQGIAGATVLADGRIALIVNPVQLAQPGRAALAKAMATAPAVATPAAPLIMVVDDSLTVRKITSRLLEREGYQVLMARDGVDALEQMKETLPDVMLVDIEMPRMDGFDLARHVRGDPRTHGIPIIIITSRTAEKHRSRAEQLGVNAFLGKPFQEAALLQHIESLLGGGKPPARYH